jgi:hypothetical protein
MVSTVLDPIRMPTVTLSEEELETYLVMIEQGQLPADWLDRYYEAVQANVFGHDHKTNKHGDPIEQGHGAPGNQTANSVAAYVKYCGPGRDRAAEPGYEENLKRIQAEFAKCEEARKAKVQAAKNRRSKRIGASR